MIKQFVETRLQLSIVLIFTQSTSTLMHKYKNTLFLYFKTLTHKSSIYERAVFYCIHHQKVVDIEIVVDHTQAKSNNNNNNNNNNYTNNHKN